MNFINIEQSTSLEISSREIVLNELNNLVGSIIIENEEQFGKATELLKKIKEQIKIVDEKRTENVKPLNDFVKEINAKFKPVSEKAEKIKKMLEEKILSYHKILQERQQKEAEENRQKELEELKRQKEIQSAANDFLDDDEAKEQIESIFEKKIEQKTSQIIEPKKTFSTDLTKTSFKKVWDYEIIDTEKIMVNLMSPDPKKIKEAIAQGLRNAPGLRIFEKDVISSR